MSTVTRHFLWESQHSETGIEGWMPELQKDNPDFTPSNALGVAHNHITLSHPHQRYL